MYVHYVLYFITAAVQYGIDINSFSHCAKRLSPRNMAAADVELERASATLLCI